MAALFVLALALNWPFVGGGFQADDLLLLNQMAEEPLPYSRLRGLWSNADIDTFAALWWRDADMDGTFWRPIPSIVFEGSVWLFGHNAVPLHILSLLLHGLVTALIFAVVRRAGGDNLVAFLSGLLFVACEDHALPVGWISTVTDLFCVTGIMLALWLHLGWLQKRQHRYVAGMAVVMVLALACKETAAAAPVLVVMATFFMPTGRDGAMSWTLGELRKRLVDTLRDGWSWLPATAVLIVFLGLYKGLHLGGMHNLMYADPLSDPVHYLTHLVGHLPIMWLATVSPVPPSLAMFSPELIPPLAIAGALAMGALIFSLRGQLRRGLVSFALVGYLAALLPQMGADASERGLYLPVALASIPLAVLLSRVGFLARRLVPRLESVARIERWAGWYILLGVLAPGLLLSAVMPFMYVESLAAPANHALTAREHIERRAPDHVLVLNTAGMFDTLYVKDVLDYYMGARQDLRLLSSCNAIMSVERVDERAFVLRADRPGWLSNMFARLVRTEPRLAVGHRRVSRPFTTMIEEVTSDGSDVLAVRFELDRPLNDRSLLFLRWNGDAFVPIDVGELPVGQPEVLADSSDVWASMM